MTIFLNVLGMQEAMKEFPNAELIEVTKKHEGWIEFFRYFEFRLHDGTRQKIYYDRISLHGYERFENDHRHLEEIRKDAETV